MYPSSNKVYNILFQNCAQEKGAGGDVNDLKSLLLAYRQMNMILKRSQDQKQLKPRDEITQKICHLKKRQINLNFSRENNIRILDIFHG